MKRIIVILLILMSCMIFGAWGEEIEPAEESEPSYTFDLSVNGKHDAKVQQGDIVTVVFSLIRSDTDDEDSYRMYAMQNEIDYDDAFALPVENGCIAQSEIQTSDIALRGSGRALYMNYLSLAEGAEWNDAQLIGTFQLKITGDSGVSVLKCANCSIGGVDGMPCDVSCNDLTLYISDVCSVRFGADAEPIEAKLGEKLEKPNNTEIWYKDFDRIVPWNFDVDTVRQNMTLYAAEEVLK